MATIIVPKIIQPHDSERPLIFLAGPIRGGGDWQAEMARELIRQEPDVQIACPCRWPAEHPLAEYFVEPYSINAPNRQLHWERHYMELAALNDYTYGCLLFWLGLEDQDHPHPGPEPYAMDTRRELGKFTGFHKLIGISMVVGGSEEFHGLSVIKDELNDAEEGEFPFYTDMSHLATAALDSAWR